jgi:penicillin V acylase-like amidase (Ntn superfamily)
MMRRKQGFSASIALSVLWFCIGPGPSPAEGCSSFTLIENGYAVFAANYDNDIHPGMLYINKRGLLKTGWTAGTTGETARWISNYASVTVNQATYQFPWAGMNEKGLSLSTMALRETVTPAPDERPPLEYGPLWMQYILDTCATIEDVIASDAKVRLVSTVDHYLVADRTGKSAVIEFLDGEMVVHTGDDLQVSALTNTPYEDSLGTWLLHRGTGNPNCSGSGDSLERFCTVAGRVDAFPSTTTGDAVDYAFETLGIVESGTPWSVVYDTGSLRAYFRTQPYDEIRFVDLLDADLGCQSPAQMLDVHEELSGDITDAFSDFDFDIVLQLFVTYISISQSDPIPIDQLREMLLRVTGYPCVGRVRCPSGRVRPDP